MYIYIYIYIVDDGAPPLLASALARVTPQFALRARPATAREQKGSIFVCVCIYIYIITHIFD